MTRGLQRTIIITIRETWTLVWAEAEGQTGDAPQVESLASGPQPPSTDARYLEIAQTLRITSSSVIRPLPGKTKQS